MLGGAIMLRISINKALWLFGFVQLLSIGGFAILALSGPIVWLLAAVISFEYLGVGSAPLHLWLTWRESPVAPLPRRSSRCSPR